MPLRGACVILPREGGRARAAAAQRLAMEKLPESARRRLIEQVPILKCFPPEAREAILAGARVQAAETGRVFLREGDAVQAVGAVLSGRVKVCRTSAEGKETILHILGPGKLFGEASLAGTEPSFPADVVALEPSRVWLIEKREVVGWLGRYPQVAWEVLSDMASKLAACTARLEELSTRRVEARIAGLFLKLASLGDPGKDSELLLTRKEVAALTGTTVETAIRVTRALEKVGAIACGRGRIRILKREALEKAAK